VVTLTPTGLVQQHLIHLIAVLAGQLIHQPFAPGRTAQLLDLVDEAGVPRLAGVAGRREAGE